MPSSQNEDVQDTIKVVFLPVAVLLTTGGAAVGDGGGLEPGAV